MPYVARTHEEEAIETLRKFVSRWGSLLAVLGAGVGLYVRHEFETDQIRESQGKLDRDFSLLRGELSDLRAFGPSGFLNPQFRTGLEVTIREALRAYNAEFENKLRSYRRQFRQLNPTIHLPEE